MVKIKIHLDRKKSLGERIYLSLREKIISTELYPLTEISEGELSKIINVSRTPIRDALKKLENEGLFSLDNKVDIPQSPNHIGIVTSSSTAAFQ